METDQNQKIIESDKKFSVRGVIVTILLIILIICVLLWLFPIKKGKDITYVTEDSNRYFEGK